MCCLQAARPSVTHIMSQRAGFSSPLQMDPERMPAGTGSGLVWDTHGHIVTNFHVIQDSTALKVTLSNQRSYDAVPVGVDPNNDIAVLKINVSDPTPALRIGTSHDLMVGQKVFAIGNPFGLDQTLTGARGVHEMPCGPLCCLAGALTRPAGGRCLSGDCLCQVCACPW